MYRSMTCPPSVTSERDVGSADRRLELVWTFRVAGKALPAWRWAEQGLPPLVQLQPVRIPRSSNRHRHIPVTAYSMVNSDFVQLESGLEHDLLRRVDRDPAVRGLLAQPFRLSWKGCSIGHHTPDLLTWHDDRSVTVWDARSVEDQDEDFLGEVAVTARACELVGWQHRVFPGLGQVERLNLLWLHGFRRQPLWSDEYEIQIKTIVGGSGVSLGDLFAHDDGSGQLIALVWHRIWRGTLLIDMDAPWGLDTMVTFSDAPMGGRHG